MKTKVIRKSAKMGGAKVTFRFDASRRQPISVKWSPKMPERPSEPKAIRARSTPPSTR
jgi:hypothetical protein